MAKKKAEMPAVVPPTVEEVVAESASIAEVVAAVDTVGPSAPESVPVPVVFEEAIAMPVPMDDVVAEMAVDSGADFNEGDAGLPGQTTTFAVITREGFTGDRLVRGRAFEIPVRSVTVTGGDLADAPIIVPVATGSVQAPGPVVPLADLRVLRSTLDTLVSGCHNQQDRHDAAAPAIKILDRLIGA